VFLLATGQVRSLAAADHYGQVTFEGLPVPGATVTATQGDSSTPLGASPSTPLGASRRVVATTDRDGIYRLADLAEGLWTLTVEKLGFATLTRELTIPAVVDPPPLELALRTFDDLAREMPPPPAASSGHESPSTPASGGSTESRSADAESAGSAATATSQAFQRAAVTQPVAPQAAASAGVLADLTPIDPTGMGAADGLLINGSLNNGASTPFAQPRAFGNNRPNQRSLFTYAAGMQMGNSAWDARPYSLTGAPAALPSYTNTQALGSFQGPVRVPGLRNRINLFLGYQGGSDTNTIMQSTRMPTDRERAGDFSQTLDPFGQPARVVDPLTGVPFAGSVVPADRISPQAASLLAYYPHADPGAAGRYNYQAPVVTATVQNAFQSRMAYAIDNRNQLQGSLSYQRTASDVTTLFGFEDERTSGTLDAQATWSWRLSPFAALRTRYQYTRVATTTLPYFANRVNVSGEAGITGNNQDPLNWGPPTLSFASDVAGLTTARYSTGAIQTHTWWAEGSRFRGRHNLTFGGEVRRHLNDVVGQQDPLGRFGFTGAATGLDFADFLLGLPQTSSIADGNPDKYFRGASYAAYVVNDWRVGPTLTVNLGLRWEYEAPLNEAQGRLVNLDVAPGFTAIAPVLAGETGSLTGRQYSTALVRTDKGGVQPRLSLAWRPIAGSSLVVRAGYGIYRTPNVYQSIATLLAQQPPLSSTFDVETSPEQPLTLADGFSASGQGLNTFAVDPDFRVPQSQNWQVTAQRDFPASLTIIAAYLGTRGSRLMQQFLPNTYPAGGVNPCPSCPSGFRYLVSNGRSLRHAGQVEVRRRLRNGFTSSLQYTLARSMDNAGAFGGASLEGGVLAQNWLDLEAEYARSSFDQRHLVTVTAEYTTGAGIMGGTLVDGWKGRLFKDWTFVTNLSTGSGLPLTPVFFSPVQGTGIIGSIRPDASGVAIDAPPGSYASPASFATPAPGQWGNAARNSITGPATFSLNAAVARTFRIGDRLNMDWRIDAFNVLNQVTYASVNTLITSPQFGLPNRANDMRKLRTSLRVRF
jgi:hypothetical protein